MRRSQAQQEFDPGHIRCRIAPLASSRTTDRGDQPDALVVAKGIGRQARALGDFFNAQKIFHGVILKVRVRSKSTTLWLIQKPRKLAGECPHTRRRARTHRSPTTAAWPQLRLEPRLGSGPPPARHCLGLETGGEAPCIRGMLNHRKLAPCSLPAGLLQGFPSLCPHVTLGLSRAKGMQALRFSLSHWAV